MTFCIHKAIMLVKEVGIPTGREAHNELMFNL